MRSTEESVYDMAGDGPPVLVVLSGPSGVGKDSVLRQLKELGRSWHITVTATTRTQRPGEDDGIDYLFLERDTFHQKLRMGEFLEYAEVYGNWYGVPRTQVASALERGIDVIIKADVQGTATIKALVPGAISIFLMPPSPEELERRLRERKTETTFDLDLRIRTAMDELYQLALFDYVVLNDDLEAAAIRIEAIVTAEKCRIPSRRVHL